MPLTATAGDDRDEVVCPSCGRHLRLDRPAPAYDDDTGRFKAADAVRPPPPDPRVDRGQ